MVFIWLCSCYFSCFLALSFIKSLPGFCGELQILIFKVLTKVTVFFFSRKSFTFVTLWTSQLPLPASHHYLQQYWPKEFVCLLERGGICQILHCPETNKKRVLVSEVRSCCMTCPDHVCAFGAFPAPAPHCICASPRQPWYTPQLKTRLCTGMKVCN